MEHTCCASCHKEYELCRKYGMREDDLEYSITPRMLKCLHTCCTSCLESMVEKNPNGHIVCPICKEISIVKGVRYLPFDACAMLNTARSDILSMMMYCNKCHDEVPAFSWCMQCSHSLCEFHHSDHKRTIDTKNHKVHTLSEIAAEHIDIEPHLPPIPCPDVMGEEASLFCHTCCHPMSTPAMVHYHRTHDYDDASTYQPRCVDQLSSCVTNLTDMKVELQTSIRDIKGTIRNLDDIVDTVATKIVEEIEELRAALAERENRLLQRLESIANEKRLLLTNQLNLVTDILDECVTAVDYGEALLVPAVAHEQEGLYVIASKPTVTARYKELKVQMDKLKLTPVVKPVIRTSFDAASKDMFQNMLSSLGALHIQDINGLEGGVDAAVSINSDAKVAKNSHEDGVDVKGDTSLSTHSTAEGKQENSDVKSIAAAQPNETTHRLNPAKFAIRMSPNVSVETATKREVRNVRSAVIEIRSSCSHSTSCCSNSKGSENCMEADHKLSTPISKPKTNISTSTGHMPRTSEEIVEGVLVTKTVVEDSHRAHPSHAHSPDRVWRATPPSYRSRQQNQLATRPPAEEDGLLSSDVDEYDSDEGEDSLDRSLDEMLRTGKQIAQLREKNPIKALESKYQSRYDALQGSLIGRVVIVNETAQTVMNKHEVRTMFESIIHDDQLPVMRITTEVIPKR